MRSAIKQRPIAGAALFRVHQRHKKLLLTADESRTNADFGRTLSVAY